MLEEDSGQISAMNLHNGFLNKFLKPQYILRININSDGDIRRFCEVGVDRKDNIYLFQPRIKERIKVTCHEPGEPHLKENNEPELNCFAHLQLG